jgi:hypothetical protein
MIINSTSYTNTKNVSASVQILNLININSITNTIAIRKQVVSGSTQIADTSISLKNSPILSISIKQ